ncbi:ATP-binding protein [Kitasatospora sp. NPDC057223]|uniref:ATP-binding protein n=1 Tax=Kitasatospora sp. NPDC057223 TaxID=3346055 RepID=UPI00363A3B77
MHRVTIRATSPDLAGRLGCLGPVKDALRDVAEGWGISGDGLGDVMTVAYELVVNALRYSPPGLLQAALLLSPDGDRVVVEVYDLTTRMPRVPDGAFGDDEAECGRGLLMVGALSAQCGANVTAGGKRVWAELVLPAPVSVPKLSRAVRRDVVLAEALRTSHLRAVPRRPRVGAPR